MILFAMTGNLKLELDCYQFDGQILEYQQKAQLVGSNDADHRTVLKKC